MTKDTTSSRVCTIPSAARGNIAKWLQYFVVSRRISSYVGQQRVAVGGGDHVPYGYIAPLTQRKNSSPHTCERGTVTHVCMVCSPTLIPKATTTQHKAQKAEDIDKVLHFSLRSNNQQTNAHTFPSNTSTGTLSIGGAPFPSET